MLMMMLAAPLARPLLCHLRDLRVSSSAEWQIWSAPPINPPDQPHEPTSRYRTVVLRADPEA
jgi:hypothetical protein